MPTIGEDADILLSHPALNGGAAYGFLLDREAPEKNILVERTTWMSYEGSWFERTKITVLLVLANQMTNPDGSINETTLAQWYTNYLALRGMVEGLTLSLPMVTFTGLKCSAFACKERHLEGRVELTLVLNSGNWPELQRVAGLSTITETPVAPVAEAGSWYFDMAIHSGQLLTI